MMKSMIALGKIDARLKVAALGLLLCLSLAAVLLLGGPRAGATGCTGRNLLADLQRDDPAEFARIEAEAARIENGKGLLWKVEKAGIPPSYLFGTMHVSDPRITELPPPAAAAYEAAGTVVIETTEVLEPNSAMAVMARHPELMMFTDGTTLDALIPPADLEAVTKGLEARGMPLASVIRMKPWMISGVLALSPCEVKRKDDGADVLDVRLGLDAKAVGKQVKGLETAEEQLEAMASLPMEFHIDALVNTLRAGDQIDDVSETMTAVYKRGEVSLLLPLLQSALPADEDGDSGYDAFEQTIVIARNKRMAERARPILDEGGAFIAVGALHLPGTDGLVALLRKAGYTVTRAD